MRTIRFISKSDAAFNIAMTSDSDTVTVPMIRKGDYELIITADGFQEYSENIAVVGDDEFQIFLDEIEAVTIIIKIDDTDITQTAIRIDGHTINNPVISLGDTNPNAHIKVWE